MYHSQSGWTVHEPRSSFTGSWHRRSGNRITSILTEIHAEPTTAFNAKQLRMQSKQRMLCIESSHRMYVSKWVAESSWKQWVAVTCENYVVQSDREILLLNVKIKFHFFLFWCQFISNFSIRSFNVWLFIVTTRYFNAHLNADDSNLFLRILFYFLIFHI